MKKVLSLVLVIAMVLSSMSFAFAAKFEDVNGDYEKAVNALSALGLINGYPDGTFKPENAIKRAELAKLLVIGLGYEGLVGGSASNFSDMKGHWADGYVAIAAGTGLVQGYPNGTFAPEKTVTFDEALTMVIRALGYTDASLKGTWPTNYKVKAIDIGLTKNVTMAKADADRGGVAQVLFNALGAKLVEVSDKGVATPVTTGALTLVEKVGDKVTDTIDKNNIDSKHDDYYGDIVELAPYMYQKVDLYLNKDGEVVFVSKIYDTLVTGEFVKDTTPDSKIKVKVDDKTKSYDLSTTSAIKVLYNGVEEIFANETNLENGLDKADVKIVVNDNDKVVGIIADKATSAYRVTAEYVGKGKLQGQQLPLNDDKKVDFTKLTVVGAVDNLEDINEDDIIVLFAPFGVTTTTTTTSKLTIKVVRDVVEGKITGTKDNDFLINGSYYSQSSFANATPVLVKDEGTFFLDHKGDIFAFEASKESAAVDYAVVTDAINGVFNTRKLAEPEITLVNGSGNEVTYKIKSSATIKTSPTATATDLLTDASGNAVSIDTTKLNVTNRLNIVKYSINDKNELTALTVYQTILNNAAATPVDTTKASFVLENNVLIFNYDNAEVTVVNKDDLADSINVLHSIDNSRTGAIELLLVKGTGAKDIYALITSTGTRLNADNKEVQVITTYVDGEKKEFEANNVNVVTGTSINTGKLVKLVLDGGVVKADPVEATKQANLNTYQEVTRVIGNRFQVANGTWFTLADEATVYVLKSDSKFSEVGSIDSILGSTVMAYNTDANNGTNVVEYLLVK